MNEKKPNFTYRKPGKVSRRLTALMIVSALFFAQSDAQAFLALNASQIPASILTSGESLQNPAPFLAEKSIVQTAILPLQESEFKIPQSVLAQFNPMAGERGSYHSKIYYDASGRRVLRQEFSNKNYFEIYRQAPGIENGKIREVRQAGLRNYKFYYYSIGNREAVRMVSLATENKTGAPYQAFEILKNGTVGRLLETGTHQRGHFVRQRIYDYKAGTITLNPMGNLYEKHVYELKPTGEPGRPIQYRNRTASGELFHIRFLYNDQEKTLTCLHVNGLHYAVYAVDEKGSLGALQEIGTAKSVTASGQILPATAIELSMLQRGHGEVPVYIFRQSGTSGYVMRERSVEGPDGLGIIGRVLRYVDTGVDLEYFYENRRGNHSASLAVLNHLTQERIRFELPEKLFDESQGRFQQASKTSPDILRGAVGHDLKKFSSLQSNLVFEPTGHYQILKSYEEGFAFISFLSRLLRGPPVDGLKIFELSEVPS